MYQRKKQCENWKKLDLLRSVIYNMPLVTYMYTDIKSVLVVQKIIENKYKTAINLKYTFCIVYKVAKFK